MALVTLQRSPSPSNDPEEDAPEGGEDSVDGRTAPRHKRSKSTLERLRKIFSTVRFISKLRPWGENKFGDAMKFDDPELLLDKTLYKKEMAMTVGKALFVGYKGSVALNSIQQAVLSESYFTIKGAALILPHNDLARKTSKRNHGGEIQRHLQSMLYILRPEDKIKVAIRLEGMREGEHRYMALVSTIGRQDTEECVILGLDCGTPASTGTAPQSPMSPTSPVSPVHAEGGAMSAGHAGSSVQSSSVGLVLPIWMGMKVRLSGDGGFSISVDDKSYLFKPVSVQAMWSAIQSLDKSFHVAEQMKYLPEGLTHTWVEYYRSKMDLTDHDRLCIWHQMEDVEVFAPSCLSYKEENESEKLKLLISTKLKEVMMSVDLDEATSKFLRTEVEKVLGMNLDQYRNYFDEETLRILGQMDAPSQILDFLFLGSEWNASNLEELQRLGIKYILNVTREIDNFFTGLFHYCNVRLYDHEDSELMKHWLKTYKFINKAKKHDCKVLVHCKMGISRSASTVMAYLMKENRWTLGEAFSFVKERRSCVRPNKGFMEQLQTYEGILSASNKREIFRSQTKQNMADDDSEEGENEASQQGNFLGDSLFQVMSHPDWPQGESAADEETLLRKGYISDHEFSGMEADLETRSADSLEESAPDVPCPAADVPLHFDITIQCAGGGLGDTSPGKALALKYGDMLVSPGAREVQAASRIRPDSSWIRLETSGESSTDVIYSDTGAVQIDSLPGSVSEGGVSHRLSPCVIIVQGESSLGGCNTHSQGNIRWSAVEDTHKIKPDSSWIRLDLPGESSTDVEEMDTTECYQEESNSEDFDRIDLAREPVLFVVGEDEDMKPAVSSPPPKTVTGSSVDVGMMETEKSAEDDSWSRDDQQVQGMEMGVHQYYSREQIPWSQGKVRNLLLGLQQGGQSGQPQVVSSGESQVRPSSRGQQARDEVSVVDPAITEALRMVAASPQQIPHCESCMEPSYSQLEAGEGHNRPRSVYEEEEIFMMPGTVRRTLQEIEERNRVNKEENLFEPKGMQRSSSFKESSGKSSPHSRQSERRRTCTPILSPDHSSEDLEVQGAMTATATVMLSLKGVASDDGIVDAASDKMGTEGSQDESVKVYTYGEEEVPVKLGTVRRHMQEIESKAGDGQNRQRALSEGNGSSTDGSLEITGVWSPPQSPCKNPDITRMSDTSPISSEFPNLLTAKGQRISLPESSAEVPRLKSSMGFEPPCVLSSIHNDRPLSSSAFKPGDESPPHAWGVMPLGYGNNAEADDAKKSVASWSPYSPSAPGRKGGNFDAETLALIREIGSAFVEKPATAQQDDDEDGAAQVGLVKHLVKNIEKESEVGKRERKIVIISKDSTPVLKPSNNECQDCTKAVCSEAVAKRHSQVDALAGFHREPLGGKLARSSSTGSAEVGYFPGTATLPIPDEQAPSVVRHLLGRFEPRSPPGDITEEEVLIVPGPSLVGSMPSLTGTVPLHGDAVSDRPVALTDRRDKFTSCTASTVTKAKSFDNQSPDFLAGHQRPAGNQVVLGDYPLASSHGTSQLARRAQCSEHSSGEGVAGHRHSVGGCPRPDGRRTLEAEEVDRGGEEPHRVRKLYGKSHPLSKLQPEAMFSSSPHSTIKPFYSTM